MKLLHHVCSSQPHARLFQLANGKFHIVGEGDLATLMIGYEYVLVEEYFAQYLSALNLPGLKIIATVIYDPGQKKEIQTHKQLLVDQQVSSEMIRNIDLRSYPDTIHRELNLEGERFLLIDQQYVFVSGALRERLEASGFSYLRFSEELSESAAET